MEGVANMAQNNNMAENATSGVANFRRVVVILLTPGPLRTLSVFLWLQEREQGLIKLESHAYEGTAASRFIAGEVAIIETGNIVAARDPEVLAKQISQFEPIRVLNIIEAVRK
jgi:hypothetical protein